jgi:hypothetical protein
VFDSAGNVVTQSIIGTTCNATQSLKATTSDVTQSLTATTSNVTQSLAVTTNTLAQYKNETVEEDQDVVADGDTKPVSIFLYCW